MSNTTQSSTDTMMKEASLFGRFLSSNDLFYSCYALGQNIVRTLSQCVPDKFPSHSARSHVELQVPWIVNQFQDCMWGIIALPVSKFQNTRISAWTLSVSVGECAEYFGNKRVLEQESLCAPCGWQISFLA